MSVSVFTADSVWYGIVVCRLLWRCDSMLVADHDRYSAPAEAL